MSYLIVEASGLDLHQVVIVVIVIVVIAIVVIIAVLDEDRGAAQGRSAGAIDDGDILDQPGRRAGGERAQKAATRWMTQNMASPPMA